MFLPLIFNLSRPVQQSKRKSSQVLCDHKGQDNPEVIPYSPSKKAQDILGASTRAIKMTE